ncbi:MAG: hypothetical protein JNK40_02130 [Chromatiales bacterium]|nr:hypothetical protein [Chromatiales bacterium]
MAASGERTFVTDPSSDTHAHPAFDRARFTCPACHELADQVWLNAYASQVSNPAGVPLRIAGAGLEQLKQNPGFPPPVRDQKVAYWNRVNAGEVFLDRWSMVQTDLFVAGLELSVCRRCMAVAVWLGGRMVYPAVNPPG